MRKLNTAISSRINRSMVLSQIQQRPMISRAELASITGLNRSAITHILNDLLRMGLVEEVRKGKAGARGGRCPIHLQVRAGAGSILALEIGLTRLTGIAADLEGREIFRQEWDIQRGEPLVELLARSLEEIRRERREIFERSLVIGIGCPGVVDHSNGRMILNLFHGWRDVEVGNVLADRFGKPVFLENDANAAAVGELYAHSADDPIGSLIYLFIRESPPGSPSPLGVGGAVLLNERLWHGAHSCAGEASQTINTVFTNIMKDLGDRLREEGRGQRIPATLADLVRLAEAGDAACVWALDRMTEQLGRFLGEFTAFLDAQGVLVYIHPPEGNEAFLKRIREGFYRYYGSSVEASVRFLSPRLGTEATLGGVIRLGLERVFVRDAAQNSVLFP